MLVIDNELYIFKKLRPYYKFLPSFRLCAPILNGGQIKCRQKFPNIFLITGGTKKTGI